MRLQLAHFHLLLCFYLQLRYKMSARRHFRSARTGAQHPAPLQPREKRGMIATSRDGAPRSRSRKLIRDANNARRSRHSIYTCFSFLLHSRIVRISSLGMWRNARNSWCSSGAERSNSACHLCISASLKPDDFQDGNPLFLGNHFLPPKRNFVLQQLQDGALAAAKRLNFSVQFHHAALQIPDASLSGRSRIARMSASPRPTLR